MRKIFLILPVLFFCFSSFSQGSAKYSSVNLKVNTFIESKMKERNIPGLTFAVLKDGKIIFSKSYGFANLELKSLVSDSTIFQLYSITKSFTAMAIMILVEEGKISLEDPVYKYIPGISAAGKSITIRQCLNHTSGMTTYTDRPFKPNEEIFDGTKQDYDKWIANFTMDTIPGERWKYIGTTYVIMAKLIEKVSGKPFGTFLNEKIFTPLQMKNTRLNSLTELIQHRASGYTWSTASFSNNNPQNDWEYGNAGMISTILDMAKWDAALYTETILKKTSWEQMLTPAKLNNGKHAPYGLGFGLTDFLGHRRVGHTGGGPGFVSAISRFIDDKITVIVFANADHSGIKIGELTNEIASFYFSK